MQKTKTLSNSRLEQIEQPIVVVAAETPKRLIFQPPFLA
jgi:hypothetical protein